MSKPVMQFRKTIHAAAALAFVLVLAVAIPAGAQAPLEPPSDAFPPITEPDSRLPGPDQTTPDQPGATQPGTAQPGSGEEQLSLKPEAKAPEQSRAEVLTDLFERLRQSPDPESAELVADAIEQIWLQSGSDTVDLLMSRVNQSLQDENLDVALDILDSVVEIAPNYSEGWNQRATVFFLKRDFRRSLDDLRQVLALEPRHFKAINGLALIMQEFGDDQAALKAFRQGLALYPQSEDMKRIEEELSREVEGQGI